MLNGDGARMLGTGLVVGGGEVGGGVCEVVAGGVGAGAGAGAGVPAVGGGVVVGGGVGDVDDDVLGYELLTQVQ